MNPVMPERWEVLHRAQEALLEVDLHDRISVS